MSTHPLPSTQMEQKLAGELLEAAANRGSAVKKKEDMHRMADANKASVNFHTDHSRGSLARVLTIISEGGINLSKLQSFPIPGSDWKYSFHADMEFDNLHQFNQVIENMQPITQELKVYGVYKNGRTVE